jgi:hypothetical protein
MMVMSFSMILDIVGISVYGAGIYYDAISDFYPSLISFACSLTGIHCVSVVVNMYLLKSSALAKFSKSQRETAKKPDPNGMIKTTIMKGAKSSDAYLVRNDGNAIEKDMQSSLMPTKLM